MNTNRNFHFLKRRPLFLLLLPVFFVLHGFISNYGSVNPLSALLLTLLYIGISLFLVAIGWFIFHDLIKSSLFAFAVMLFQLFFGYIQDILKDISPIPFFSQYRFLLPINLILFILFFIWLGKREKKLFSLTAYLNVLLFLLLLTDSINLTKKISQYNKISHLDPASENYQSCDTCKKPDIFFILLDQYAGNTALKEVFNFDNSSFENELTHRGFHVDENSNSNYNLTPFSIASILNMNYLSPEMGTIKHLNLPYSYNMIRNSSALRFLSTEGYRFYNLSIFDFPGQPAKKYTLLPYGTKLITAQTFTSRLWEAVRSDIISGKISWAKKQKQILYEHLHFNDDNFEMLRNIAGKITMAPKFVYAHFMLPHFPYYYDSKGNAVPIERLKKFSETNAKDYIEYLQYGNPKILKVVDDIIAASPSPPIIILLSDHGFRHPEKRIDIKYDFSCLNAVLLPDRDYTLFTDSMSNVNVFRTIFNSSFNQHFPLLKDSTINLW